MPSGFPPPTPTEPRHRIILGKPRHIFGWKPDIPDHRDQMLAAPPLRRKLALVSDLSEFCSPTEDQDNLGSCTANAGTSMMELLYIKAGRTAPQLSRIFLYYFSRILAGVPPSEDSGAFIRDVMKALATYGTCLEALWPYVIKNFSVKPNAAAIKDAKNHQILQFLRCPNLSQIRYSLCQGFSLEGGFSVPASMMSAETTKTGVVKVPKKGEEIIGGHAVHFVGHNDRTRRLKFQNSWGNWGEHGFGYLPYAFVETGLADDFQTIRQQEM